MNRRGWMGWIVLVGLTACGNDGAAPTKPGDGPATTGAQASTAAAAAPAAAQGSGPLASLGGVARTLNDGVSAFLGGKDPAGAFPGWEATAKDAGKLREEIKAAGGATAVHVMMEFELIFEKDKKDVYYLRTGVTSFDSASVFVQFEGREPEGGKVEVSSQPIEAYTGGGAPFKEAADALVKALRGPECAKLPVATAQDVTKIAPDGPLHDDLAKGLEKARANVDVVCKAMAALGSDKVRLRIDDQTFVVKNASGAVIGAIRGDFKAEPGKITYTMSRFRAVK